MMRYNSYPSPNPNPNLNPNSNPNPNPERAQEHAVAARCQLLLAEAAVPLQACARGMLARRALARGRDQELKR